jgi:hypothetical protein
MNIHEPSNTGIPHVVHEQGTDMEITIGAHVIEEYLQKKFGPEWWKKMYRGDVPWAEAVKMFWVDRLN